MTEEDIKAGTPCPLCGGKVEFVSALTEELAVAPAFYIIGRRYPMRLRPCLCAACCECEFMEEIEE